MAAMVLKAGMELGRFHLVEKIAEGGMAEIWSARNRGETSEVALKVLKAEKSQDRHVKAMFKDEVNIARRLKHRNIGEVYDSHEVSGRIMQSMELLKGKDLRQLLVLSATSKKRIPTGAALMIVREVARGLAYAHSKRSARGETMNIVHRDVSPQNIMVTMDGEVKVVDFGIALASNRIAKTTQNIIKGKMAYMAPEQAQAKVATRRADIFALGVVLWEMLAMRRLFKGRSNSETYYRLLETDVPPICDENPTVPQEVGDLLGMMLAKEEQERLVSMDAVESGLSRILAIHYADVSAEDLQTWIQDLVGEGCRPERTVSMRAIARGGVESGGSFKNEWSERETEPKGATTRRPREDAPTLAISIHDELKKGLERMTEEPTFDDEETTETRMMGLECADDRSTMETAIGAVRSVGIPMAAMYVVLAVASLSAIAIILVGGMKLHC